MTAAVKANNDGSAAIQVGGSDAIQISAALNTTFVGTVTSSTGALYPLVSGTAVASTSGTSIDFTGIPSTAKRITVLLSGVSTSGTSSLLVQIGSGSVQITGYSSTSVLANMTSSTNGLASTAGMVMYTNNAADSKTGSLILNILTGNTWIANHSAKIIASANIFGAGDVTLSGVLDRVRITTVNGTDTFDAGTVNIMWE